MPPDAQYNPQYFGDFSESEEESDSEDEDFEVRLPETRLDDALKYLRDIKSKFTNNIEIYQEFLALMGEFRKRRVDENHLVNRVVQIFYNYPDMVMGLNIMLPGHMVLSQDEQERYVLTRHGIQRTYPPLEELARQNAALGIFRN